MRESSPSPAMSVFMNTGPADEGVGPVADLEVIVVARGR